MKMELEVISRGCEEDTEKPEQHTSITFGAGVGDGWHHSITVIDHSTLMWA